MYPKRLIEKCTKKYLDKKFEKSAHTDINENKDKKYITLPYIGYFSNYAKKR